jgi:hypothetical protein
MRRNALAVTLSSLLLVLLAACTPTTDERRVEVEQLTEPISFYPFQAGARWEYLPDRARLTDPTTVVAVQGPTVVGNEVWVAWHARGRGLDQTSYRQARAGGVFLLREERLGTTFTFDPPLQEYPAEGQLRVGATWSGTSTVRLSADAGKQQHAFRFDYVYTVVDRRTVTLPAGEFDVFVIDFTTRTFDDGGNVMEELTQQTWFAPYVGEVRTRTGQVLVGSNVIGAAATGTR